MKHYTGVLPTAEPARRTNNIAHSCSAVYRSMTGPNLLYWVPS